MEAVVVASFQTQMDVLAHVPMAISAILAPWALVITWRQARGKFALLRAEYFAAKNDQMGEVG